MLRLGCGAVRDSTRGGKYVGTFGAKRTVLIDYLGDCFTRFPPVQ